MENFTFCSPTEFVFGRGTENQTGELLKSHGAAKVLLVCGGQSAERSGLIDRVGRSMDKAGIPYVTLKGVKPNPTQDKVREGVALAVAEGVNYILAVGGGSVIDTAKAIALGAVTTTDFWQFFTGKAKPIAALPVGVVLTIPAAGSEGSGTSVITNTETNQKLGARYPELLRPRFAVMDPELTFTLPWNQTAYGIVDMLCHIFERYFSPTEPAQLVDAYSEAMMRDIMDQALSVKINGEDYAARADLMWASTLAHNGLCGVGKVEDWASHKLEHEVSALYDVPHGAGLAVIFPAWLEYVGRRNPTKAWRFAINVMSVDPAGKTTEQTVEEGVQTLREFYHDLGLTTSLRELVGKEPDIEAMCKNLETSIGPVIGTYVPLGIDDWKAIYTASL